MICKSQKPEFYSQQNIDSMSNVEGEKIEHFQKPTTFELEATSEKSRERTVCVWHPLSSHCKRSGNGGGQLLDRSQSKRFQLAKGLDCRQARSAGRLSRGKATGLSGRNMQGWTEGPSPPDFRGRRVHGFQQEFQTLPQFILNKTQVFLDYVHFWLLLCMSEV